MLPRDRRLSTEALKDMQTNDEVRATHSSFFVARSLTSAGESVPARFAVIVSQKVAKSAVERHRIKRQIHSVLEELLPRLNESRAVALHTKSAVREASREEIATDLEKGLKKAGVLKNT
ncbi:MAG: ribonuclease P protein component [Candidatus Paceibacterota bacterium]